MSRANLEQILELLLAEQNEKAEEMLHEYVVAKARAEYERVLDEGDEDEIHTSYDFEDDILDDEEEIESDELGEDVDSEDEVLDLDDMDMEDDMDDMDMEDDKDMDMDMEDDMDDMDMDMEDDVDMDMEDDMDMDMEDDMDDIEDKVSDLEAELEDLRIEFEKLMNSADEDGDGDHDMDDHELELEEATNFSSKEKRQPLDGGTVKADSDVSPLSKRPKDTKVSGAGEPVKVKNGSEGHHGKPAKDHTPTDNMNVKPKKV